MIVASLGIGRASRPPRIAAQAKLISTTPIDQTRCSRNHRKNAAQP
jgi:hypothetical protein